MKTERMPGAARVAAMQCKLLLYNRYAYAILVLPLLFFLGIYRAFPSDPLIVPWHMPRLAGGLIMSGVVGALAAVLVWAGEGPSRRRYHWSLPISRETHDLLRVLAGAAWLVLAIGIFAVIGTIAEPAVMRSQWLAQAPGFYAGLFIVAILVYLLCSIYALLLDRPLVGLVITFLLIGLTQSRFTREHMPVLRNAVDAVLSSDRSLSLSNALTGAEATAPWNDMERVQAVYRATSAATLRDMKARGINYDERGEVRLWARRDNYRPLTTADWVKALLLWYGIAVCGLLVAVTRRPNV